MVLYGYTPLSCPICRAYWFGDVDGGSCTPFSGDAREIAGRIRSIRTSMDSFVPLKWELAVSCGICRDRAEYIAKLREVCFAAAERDIREQYAGKDTEAAPYGQDS